jgi:DNA repair exonuclease SbcCD ATPase subunit
MFARKGEGEVEMSYLKDTADKLKNLEAEKLNLMAELEELRRIAQAKSDVLTKEISALREEINSIKDLFGTTIPQSNFENNLAYIRGLAEKTQQESNELGRTVFPIAPFSQHFDNWLAKLQSVISNFESDPHITMDEQFVKERSQIIMEIEASLAKIKAEESNTEAIAKALAEGNHLLVETDKQYVEKAKELNAKREMEIQRLTSQVSLLETQLKALEEENSNRRILKKKTDDRIPKLIQELRLAKSAVDIAKQNFASQQEKLDDDYEKKKQNIMEQTEGYSTKMTELEKDRSVQPRQAACQSLSNAVNGLLQRTCKSS